MYQNSGLARAVVMCSKSSHGTSHQYANAGPGSRSATSMMLDIPHTTTSLGDRAFAVAGPPVCSSLPPAIRDLSLSLSVFGKLLKTCLFKSCGTGDL